MYLKENDKESLPIRSTRLAFTQILDMTGIKGNTLLELIEYEWISPVKTGDGDFLFGSKDLYRLKKLARLCRDLEISAAGGSIIVDLLERIEQLEVRLSEMRRLI
ncbi:chaperone modulator CbpM [Maridesulfovibrio bastinii]|jgi:hypothetical protein|uniref:chaperone modulator CbpM n=1 Tax=Maridesulfovibrio bastinii TaxID=47157 RepID=UPI000424AC9C|nr:chaperone modulator CbpM [Maridesulfovibrio bastinii]